MDTMIQVPELHTRGAFQPRTVNTEARTIDLTFSTGAPVERSDWATGGRYLEVLSLDPAHVRIDRLNAGGPVLNAHRMTSVADLVGVVVAGTVKLAPTAARAVVKFSRRPDVEPIWQDVREGLITGVSVGYRTYVYKETEPKRGALPVRTAVDWEPYEISMVPIPADAGAKTRGRELGTVNKCLLVRAGGPRVCAICGLPGTLEEHRRCVEPFMQDRPAHFGEPWL